MAKYTVIMDWEGGTYINQSLGDSVHQAVCRWAESLDVAPIEGMGPASKFQLIAGVHDDDGSPLLGLSNVWCYCAVIRGKLALINVVRTDELNSE